MYSKINLIIRVPLVAFLLAATLMGCDNDNETTPGDTVRFEGRVTDEPGFGKSAAAIEGAVVTAANVDANGSLTTLAAEATTNAAGAFSLQAEGATDLVILKADKESFHSEVLVYSEPSTGTTVRTMPMTVESEAEAAVYVEIARNGSAGDMVTVADVAAYVNQSLAAEWKTGATTAAQIVAALEASAQAEADYFEEDDEAEVDAAKVRREEQRSFLTLQTGLNAAATASAQTTAIADFEQALITAYTEAGASLEAQAKARQTARAALVKFYSQGSAEARFALRQQAEILTALATCRAIEAAFDAEGATEARLTALAQARTSLMASLRGASNEGQIENAHATYESGVEAELMAELNVGTAMLAIAETALTSAKVSLDATVASAASAGAVASAYTTFYTTAETSTQAILATTGSAEFGARVLTLLTVQ